MSRSEAPVYRLWNDGLGDHWASINLLAHLSMARGMPVRFMTENRFAARHAGILATLDLSRADLSPCSERTGASLDGFNVWATPYLPTKRRWGMLTARPFVCAHFEGLSSAAEKNPPVGDLDRIQAWADERGLPLYPLTRDLTIEKIVDLLAQCTLFIGVDSGMSHIAHSVGCPTYILEYRLPIVTCHRHKTYVRCDGARHFTEQADTWLGYTRFLRT